MRNTIVFLFQNLLFYFIYLLMLINWEATKNLNPNYDYFQKPKNIKIISLCAQWNTYLN
jgi:hypothetical protein